MIVRSPSALLRPVRPRVWPWATAWALVLAGVVLPATPAEAQRDEFDFIDPQTGAAPESVPADLPVADEERAAVVRVRVATAPELAQGRLPCAHGRVAFPATRVGTGYLFADGSGLVVPSALVEDAYAIGVVLGDAVVVARTVRVDPANGIALVRLTTPMAGRTATARGTAPTVGDVVTLVGRDGAGTERARSARIAEGAAGRFELVAGATPDLSGTAVFRGGRFIGFVGSLPPSGAGRQVVVDADAVTRLSTVGAPPEASTTPPSIVAASSAYLTLATATTAADRCAALAALPGTAVEPLPDAAAGFATGADRMMLAALAWNAYVVNPGTSGEPLADERVADHLRAATALDVTLGDRMITRLVVADAQRREAERRASEAEAQRRVEAAQAEAERREERRNRPITYTVGGTLTAARDGAGGMGSGGVSGGFFASVPRLRADGSFRAALALGSSVALTGDGGGFVGLLSVDLGVTLRVGGSTGGFVLLAYAPSVLTGRLEGAGLAASAYRVAAGVALRRRVLYVGYRVAAPPEDYPLHLFEVGVAWRHGPAAPSRSGTEVALR